MSESGTRARSDVGSAVRGARADAPGGAASGSDRRTIAYQPALDGVRAVAVLAVLLFHAEVPGFDGGYLGVSVFFTLSGYLITSLLAAEMEREGRIALGSFYARRARRLVPASVLVVMLVVAARSLTDWFDAVDSLRAHAIGSLLQVANWVFLAGGGSYQDLLEQRSGTASPLEHYWSLAIEEQFYWLWPVAFVGLWRVGRSARGRLLAVGVVAGISVVAAPVIAAVWGADAAYWSTPARVGEILLGAVAALVLRHRVVDRRWALLAPVALVVLAICVVTFPTVGGPAYGGALPAVGLVSVALIIGLQAPSSTRSGLSVAPLVWIGTVSYGVYLFHWPIFVVVDEDRLGVGGPILLATRFGLTFVVALASFAWFERPIRHGLRITPRASLAAAAGATAIAVAIAAIVVPGPRGAYWEADADGVAAAAIVVDDGPVTDEPLAPAESLPAPTTVDDALDDAVDDAPDGGADDATDGASDEVIDDGDPGEGVDAPAGDAGSASDPAASSDESTATDDDAVVPTPSRPIRVLVAGDSTAQAMGAGVVGWAAANPDLAQAEVMALPGCGFVRGGEYFLGETWNEYQEGCSRYFFEALPERAAEVSADVVVLLGTSWDLLDRRWDDGERREPAAYTDRIDADYGELTAAVLAAGVGDVVWLEMPVPNQDWETVDLADDRAAFGLLRTAMDQAAATTPDRVTVLDLEAWFDGAGLAGDRGLRPDGIHFTPEAATDIADAWLGDQLLRVALAG